MDERKPMLNDDPSEHGSRFGWKALAVVISVVVWLAFRPPGPVWLYVSCWVAALAAADGVARLVRHRVSAHRRPGRTPSPSRRVAGLPGLGPESWLLDHRYVKARTAAAGFLVFATLAAIMGRNAAQEYRMLATLRDHGGRTAATVVEITGGTAEGRPAAVTIRFGTPSGPVQADVDVSPSSEGDAAPGAKIPVAYNPAAPAQVAPVDHLDGRDADGIREGSIVIGLLAAGLLVGAAWEAVRAKRQTEAARRSATQYRET